MSISFYIQNRKGLFSYKAVETPLSLVSMVEGLEVFGLEGEKAYQSLDQVGTFLPTVNSDFNVKFAYSP